MATYQLVKTLLVYAVSEKNLTPFLISDNSVLYRSLSCDLWKVSRLEQSCFSKWFLVNVLIFKEYPAYHALRDYHPSFPQRSSDSLSLQEWITYP